MTALEAYELFDCVDIYKSATGALLIHTVVPVKLPQVGAGHSAERISRNHDVQASLRSQDCFVAQRNTQLHQLRQSSEARAVDARGVS